MADATLILQITAEDLAGPGFDSFNVKLDEASAETAAKVGEIDDELGRISASMSGVATDVEGDLTKIQTKLDAVSVVSVDDTLQEISATMSSVLTKVDSDVVSMQTKLDTLHTPPASSLTAPILPEVLPKEPAVKPVPSLGGAVGAEDTTLLSGAKDTLEGVTGTLETVGGTASGLMNMVGGLGPLAAITGGVAGLDFVRKGIETAGSIQQQYALLTQAMKDQGQQISGPMATSLQDHVDSLGQVGVEEGSVLQSMQAMVQAGVPWNVALNSLTTSADLAAAKHMTLADGTLDAASATHALILGAQGQGRALKDLGITLPPTIDNAKALAGAQDAVSKAQQTVNNDMERVSQTVGPAHAKALEKLAADSASLTEKQGKLDLQQQLNTNHMGQWSSILDVVNPKVKDQSTAAANTYEGAMAVLTVQMEDASNALGLGIMPLLSQFAGWVTTHQTDIKNVFSDIGQAIGGVAQVVGTVAGWINQVAQALGIVDSTLSSLINKVPGGGSIPGTGGSLGGAVGGAAAGGLGGAAVGAGIGAIGGLGIFDWATVPIGAVGGGAIGGVAGFVHGLFPGAEGGIVTGPTPMLVGEAGDEAIIPLNQLGSGGLGGGTVVHIDMSNSLVDANVLDSITEQIGYRLATSVLPRAGVGIRG